MTEINITIDSVALDAALARLLQSSSNLRPALYAIGHNIAEDIRLGFTNQLSPAGNPWAQLSAATVANRRQGSSVPLNDTGLLKNSITHNVNGNSVEIGTNVIYAAMMNFGGKKSDFPHLWGDIPARNFMPESQLPADWEADILTILEQHFSF